MRIVTITIIALASLCTISVCQNVMDDDSYPFNDKNQYQEEYNVSINSDVISHGNRNENGIGSSLLGIVQLIVAIVIILLIGVMIGTFLYCRQRHRRRDISYDNY